MQPSLLSYPHHFPRSGCHLWMVPSLSQKKTLHPVAFSDKSPNGPEQMSRFAYDTLSMRDSAVPMGFSEILSLNYDNCHTTTTVNDAFDVEFSDSIQEKALSCRQVIPRAGNGFINIFKTNSTSRLK